MTSEKQKMIAGELYLPSDPEIQADIAANQQWLARYNAMLGQSAAERLAVLRERIAAKHPANGFFSKRDIFVDKGHFECGRSLLRADT